MKETGGAGGWGGIRTHEELPPGSFQDCCLKPLGHPSTQPVLADFTRRGHAGTMHTAIN